MHRLFTILLISAVAIALADALSVKQKAIESLEVPNWQSELSTDYSDTNQARTDNFTDATWLDYFENNSQLQSLIQEGILSNKDLVMPVLELIKAQAELRTVQPNRLPTIDINGQGNRQKINAPLKLHFLAKRLVMIIQPP